MNILITGASGDIGLATAEAFAKEGNNLALFGFKNMEKLSEAARALANKYGVRIKCYATDVSKPVEVSASVECVLRDFLKIDVLVNNAGISMVGLDFEMSPEDWKVLCDTNLSSAMYFTRAITPHMISNKEGRIINISSMWGVQGASCEAAYSATKGAINAYSKALGKELAPSNIAVNALALGAVDTKMNAHLSSDEKACLCESIPAGRMALPSEAAEMIVLLSKAPAYLTAQVIGFDGGF